MEEYNGKIEWKSREWKNRMEIVEMVDCNGWPFWASVVLHTFYQYAVIYIYNIIYNYI